MFGESQSEHIEGKTNTKIRNEMKLKADTHDYKKKKDGRKKTKRIWTCEKNRKQQITQVIDRLEAGRKTQKGKTKKRCRDSLKGNLGLVYALIVK